MSVNNKITALLMEAAELAAQAENGKPGHYALIVQSSVGPDGSMIMQWQWYGPGAPATSPPPELHDGPPQP
jgi:hypothetical protein